MSLVAFVCKEKSNISYLCITYNYRTCSVKTCNIVAMLILKHTLSSMYHIVLSIYHLLSDGRDMVVKLPTWVQTISEIKLLML